MSHKASNWLAEIPPELIKSGAFRVLFHLCDAHNSKREAKTACFPSQELLMKVTGLSNGGLNNALNAIEAAGLMRRRRTRNPDGTRGPTYYILGCDFKEAQQPAPESGDGTNSSFGGQPTPVSGVNQLHSTGDKPVIEPVIEPVSAQEREDLLFSAEEQPDPIEKGFEKFWGEIWPSHHRKAAKADCLKVYRLACTGKHKKADKISPDELNRCAKAYIRTVKDLEYLKAPLPWLRQPGWEPFVGGNVEQFAPKPSQQTDDWNQFMDSVIRRSEASQ